MTTNPRSFSGSLARAWRSMRRRPGFLAIAVSSLAIALGLATTVIAQIDSLMHPYVEAREPERLYNALIMGVGAGRRFPTVEEVLPILRESPIVEGVIAAQFNSSVIAVGQAGGRDMTVALVPPAYFDFIGVRPRLGRAFAENETAESGVALVSDGYWRENFGNRAMLESETIDNDGKTFRIVGVMPAHVIAGPGRDADVLLPIATAAITRPLYYLRVKKRVTTKDMNRAGEAIADHMAALFGVDTIRNADHKLVARKFSVWTHTARPDPLRLSDFHRAMIGAAIFIVLIACANVSALMLARSVTMRRDQALRMALGAGRGDLLRDVLAEVALLAAIGGAAGVMIADWSMRVMVAATPVQLRWMGFTEPRWNARVFGTLFVAVIIAIALASLIPAWYASRIQPAEPLKDSSASTTGRPARRFKLLIVGELSLAMVLLMGAALVTKTANKVQTFKFGYDARPLGQVSVQANVVATYPVARTALDSTRLRYMMLQQDMDGIVASIRALPEVRDAAWFSTGGQFSGAVFSDATLALDTALFLPQKFDVGPGFLRTLGLPILAGRDFVDGDRAGQGAVILDQRAAQYLFPSGNAVGGMVRFGNGRWARVVGLTGNAIHELPAYPEMDPRPVLYVAEPPGSISSFHVIVRANDATRDVLPTALRTARALTPPIISTSSSKWIWRYEEMLTARRFVSAIFITLSIASLLLATAGLFGVLSYAVGQRMREFAVRVALGANRPNIVRLVLRDGLVLALGGTAIGGLAALVAGFAVYQWLWGVYPVDAPSLLIAEGVLMSVTMAAAALPAMRAARANPVDVLRAM